MKGPIDYIIIGFEGGSFDGSILKTISEAIDKGIIRLIALTVLIKDTAGNVTMVDINDSQDDETLDFIQKYDVKSHHIDKEDIDETAELIPNNTAAGLLIIEHLWAVPLKAALLEKNGTVLAEGRIHPDALKDFETAPAS